ncbi:MAG: nucleotidyltransferase family protein [Prevotella sp.]|nr:nucleotidyltransferase family protein [Prevotella sp.]
MIFAAGLGTRLKPLTDTMPKALVPVGGQPLLWHVIMRLKEAGFERIVVNVHHFAQQIIDYLEDNDYFGMDIRISDEREQLLETGGGIKKALPLFDQKSPILIHNVDILSNINLNEFYEKGKDHDATLLVSHRTTKRYLLFDDAILLKGWTNIETGEVKSPYKELQLTNLNQLAFSGIHIIGPNLYSLFQKMPDRFGIMDFYLQWCAEHPIYGYCQEDLKLMDVGKLDTLHEAEQFLKEYATNITTKYK